MPTLEQKILTQRNSQTSQLAMLNDILKQVHFEVYIFDHVI